MGHASPIRGKAIRSGTVTSWFVVVAIAGGACALPALGADANDPNRPNRPKFDMSASDVGEKITRLLRDKPEVPITLPLNAEKPIEAAPLPAAGSMVVDRLCRLWSERNSTWLVLTFEPEPGRAGEPERRVLPSMLMEQMETLAARTPGMRFRVSGETTVFQEHAYLLLSKVTALPPEAPSVPTPPAKAATSTTKPTTASAPANSEPSSDDLLNALLSEKVGRPVQAVPVLPDSPKPASVAPTGPSVLPVVRGEMVADRLVRIMPDPKGKWWLAAFEADNTLQEPPMRLLPCGMLAKAQSLAAGARPGRMRVFRVSGKITRYAGNRYLLLRKVIVELNLGQF